MPEMKPRTKASKDEQLVEPLKGELATYENVGLFQRLVSDNTAYRYRGALLRYQKALNGANLQLKHQKSFWPTSASRVIAPQPSVSTGLRYRVSTLGVVRT